MSMKPKRKASLTIVRDPARKCSARRLSDDPNVAQEYSKIDLKIVFFAASCR